jgi:hypothetical protein
MLNKIDTTDGYVKMAEDHGGDLGEPFGALPASLVKCDPDVPCDPSDLLSAGVDSVILDEKVPEEGVEPPT